ncbi:hypothetical protein ACHWQZ_G006976 [Mnemiopsis leidyi]
MLLVGCEHIKQLHSFSTCVSTILRPDFDIQEIAGNQPLMVWTVETKTYVCHRSSSKMSQMTPMLFQRTHHEYEL